MTWIVRAAPACDTWPGRPHRRFSTCERCNRDRLAASCVHHPMARRDELPREIEPLGHRLPSPRVTDELSTVRSVLSRPGQREPAIQLPNLRLGFACKQRWEDMVGDERVRACNGCDRPVFNLSAMTRDEAEAVLATRGLTPCVRFYRR